MANDRRKPERKADKLGRYSDRAYKIAWSIGIAFLLYIVIPLRTDIKELRHEVSSTTKECMQEINEVRKEFTEKLFAMLNKENDK